MRSETEVVVIGAGAAGIAAGRRLAAQGAEALLLEARDRVGGRAWTVADSAGRALDLGCGWLHSADRNPWRAIAEAQGWALDKTLPPWVRPSLPVGLSAAEQGESRAAHEAFRARVEQQPDEVPDRPAADYLEPDNRWNGLINAVSTYYSGVELDRLSVRDFNRYEDSGVNWRVAKGMGALIAACASGLPIVLECPVRLVDRSGARLRLVTDKGNLECDYAIVTLPSALIAEQALRFAPPLPDKTEAAAGLPLGLADKLFLALDGAEEFAAESRVAGRGDSPATGTYHFRPFGRPMIEAYFGGTLAGELETAGAGAFAAFAREELRALFGSDFVKRLTPLAGHGWRLDTYARGSYSYALPGAADRRAALAAPVEERIFFAGEACSRASFSTAHGAFETGVAAADAILARRRR